jgi:hypothetical protein
MAFSFEEVLVEVYKQLFSDNARVVKIGTHQYPIQRSHKGHLRQVEFLFEGHDVRGMSRIQVRVTAGQRWFVLGRKLRSFSGMGATSRAWSMASCPALAE